MKKAIFFLVIILFFLITPFKIQGASLKGGDTFSRAVELAPGTYEGGMMRGGESEYFFTKLKPGQALELQVNLASQGGAIGGIVLYGEDKLLLLEKEELVQREPASFKILYLLNSEKDSHKIYIEKYCRLFYFDSFTINLSIKDFYDAFSEKDAGETPEKAIDISFNKKYKGYLSGEEGNDEKDFYKISIEKTGNLALKADSLTKTAEISVTIYDKEKNIIAEKGGSFGKEIRTLRYITKPGDYFLEFKGRSPEIISYEFELSSEETQTQPEKISFFERLNLKFIFGIILLILVFLIAGKIIYSLWKK